MTVINDSPKPPPTRLTLTLQSINRAAHSFFRATGRNKAVIVQKVLRPRHVDNLLPAQQVQLLDGTVLWRQDQDAARGLDNSLR